MNILLAWAAFYMLPALFAAAFKNKVWAAKGQGLVAVHVLLLFSITLLSLVGAHLIWQFSMPFVPLVALLGIGMTYMLSIVGPVYLLSCAIQECTLLLAGSFLAIETGWLISAELHPLCSCGRIVSNRAIVFGRRF